MRISDWSSDVCSSDLASPRTHQGKIEQPADIADVDLWIWGRDGRLYVRAYRPLGTHSMYSADMNGYAELQNLPGDVTGKLATHDAARAAALRPGATSHEQRHPGFADDSYTAQARTAEPQHGKEYSSNVRTP